MFVDTFEPNPTFENFKNISNMNLSNWNYENSLEILNLVGKAGLKLGFFDLSARSEEEFEALTNPDFYRGGVEYFSYHFK